MTTLKSYLSLQLLFMMGILWPRLLVGSMVTKINLETRPHRGFRETHWEGGQQGPQSHTPKNELSEYRALRDVFTVLWL